MKSVSIDVVENIGEKEFRKNYLRAQRPVVIKGLAKEQPAGKKWTVDYIKQVCGDVMVDLFDNNIANNASAFTKPDLKMRFGDFVDIITNDKPSSLRMFLFNMFKCKPELRNDFKCPQLFNGILGRMGFMFFGAKDVKVRIHQDIDMSNVLLTQFHGRKKVVLVEPKYSELLYRLPFNTHSLVDLDNPDYEKFPGLQYIETMECILEPGDTLYMPSGYWHYITYLDGGFAVSYRKMAIGFRAKVTGALSLFVFMPFDKLMNNILGIRWLMRKQKMATKRANKAIRAIKENTRDLETTLASRSEWQAR
jgi:hypothetical protein